MKLCYRFGSSLAFVLICRRDLASNFVSKLTQQFEKMMGCSPIFNSPLHPQATGLAERGVGSVKAIIGKLAFDHPNQWLDFLPSVLWSLREAVNSTTGLSPVTVDFSIWTGLPWSSNNTKEPLDWH